MNQIISMHFTVCYCLGKAIFSIYEKYKETMENLKGLKGPVCVTLRVKLEFVFSDSSAQSVSV